MTSPGGMYSGQNVQDVPIEDISSLRRNPVLADVMAQLDYMEKRGSGLKRICNETKALKTYKEGRDPVFKSSVSQFMTIIYSMEYNGEGNDRRNGDVNSPVYSPVNSAVNSPVNSAVNSPVNSAVNSLTGSLKEVYLIIFNNPGIKIKQLASIRKRSESTIKIQVAELKKRGYIEYRGSDKTGGYYAR